jgi:hypothetical protein
MCACASVHCVCGFARTFVRGWARGPEPLQLGSSIMPSTAQKGSLDGSILRKSSFITDTTWAAPMMDTVSCRSLHRVLSTSNAITLHPATAPDLPVTPFVPPCPGLWRGERVSRGAAVVSPPPADAMRLWRRAARWVVLLPGAAHASSVSAKGPPLAVSTCAGRQLFVAKERAQAHTHTHSVTFSTGQSHSRLLLLSHALNQQSKEQYSSTAH